MTAVFAIIVNRVYRNEADGGVGDKQGTLEGYAVSGTCVQLYGSGADCVHAGTADAFDGMWSCHGERFKVALGRGYVAGGPGV